MPALRWEAEDVLAVFARLGTRPGRGIPVQTLWHNLLSGKAIGAGVEALVALGYVELNATQTEVILTELGYRVVRGEAAPAVLSPTTIPATPTVVLPLEIRRAVILTAL